MTELTPFLREQALTGANKCKRSALPDDWSTAQEPYAIPVRKALGLKMIFDNMPLFIGEKEQIVGTRTIFTLREDNPDGTDVTGYKMACPLPYINQADIDLFGADQSYYNKAHYVPDFSILLKKGIGGILAEAEERKKDKSLKQINLDFLESVRVAYQGLSSLINRYSEYAGVLAVEATDPREKERLQQIQEVCKKISVQKPDSFREAVQLLWFGHLGTIIESFTFVTYGRLDVILQEFLKDTPRSEALQILECLLIKMYDQVDIKDDTYGEYSAQMVVTLGGLLENGENAASEMTMLFLEAIDHVNLPEPVYNLRINKKNPPEFLEKAAELSIKGRNNLAYYNDDLFIDSLIQANIPAERARIYGFDLCQDMNIPGKSDFFLMPSPRMTQELMTLLLAKDDFEDFEDLLDTYKKQLAARIETLVTEANRAQEHIFKYRDERYEEYFTEIREKGYPIDWDGKSPMSPMPLLSALYHGSLENALDLIYEPYPEKARGVILFSTVEMMNSLAAIKKVVYEAKQYTLHQVVEACRHDFREDGEEIMRAMLWNAPKWGNDDDYVDQIGKEAAEFALQELTKYKTFSGGSVLGGIHQPNITVDGKALMATPEGRHAGMPLTPTLAAENGTIKNGPTAVLKSAAKLDYRLNQWNFCVTVNYFASMFHGDGGKELFISLLKGYFAQGGLQHQPNILDVQELKDAQIHPENYQDLVVRIWGFSAHFVKLKKEMQDEVIARFE